MSDATIKMFHIPISRMNQAEAIDQIIAWAKQHHRPPKRIATMNVDFMTNAVRLWPFRGDPELWDYLQKADLVTADGMPLVWLSKLLRKPLPGRVTGSDMVPKICARCADEHLSIYVLGSLDVVLHEAFANLREDAPAIRVAGLNSAMVDLKADQTELIAHINAAKPDVLFLAMSHPKQELWISRHSHLLDTGVVMGVGASFNFLAGYVPRAPLWMQHSGLEWVYRIYKEPRRLWRRYAKGFVKLAWLATATLLGWGRD